MKEGEARRERGNILLRDQIGGDLLGGLRVFDYQGCDENVKMGGLVGELEMGKRMASARCYPSSSGQTARFDPLCFLHLHSWGGDLGGAKEKASSGILKGRRVVVAVEFEFREFLIADDWKANFVLFN